MTATGSTRAAGVKPRLLTEPTTQPTLDPVGPQVPPADYGDKPAAAKRSLLTPPRWSLFAPPLTSATMSGSARGVRSNAHSYRNRGAGRSNAPAYSAPESIPSAKPWNRPAGGLGARNRLVSRHSGHSLPPPSEAITASPNGHHDLAGYEGLSNAPPTRREVTTRLSADKATSPLRPQTAYCPVHQFGPRPNRLLW